jgi:PadR family transcriptional regulator PadR
MDQDMVKPIRSWLTPYLLLMLRSWETHGYDLIQKLQMFGFPTVDQGTVYRTLRQLEKEGFISSAWDATDGGPARRLYTLTEAGERFLSQWASALGQYNKMLESFFTLYTGKTSVSDPRNKQD